MNYFLKFYLKVNQVVYSSISVDSSGFKALVLIFFLAILLTRLQPYFFKGP